MRFDGGAIRSNQHVHHRGASNTTAGLLEQLRRQGTVASGYYRTVVNIDNPSYDPVEIAKQFSRTATESKPLP